MQNLRRLIADVPGFPQPGITFHDITPLLGDAQALRQVIEAWAGPLAGHGIRRVAGVESRGFIFGALLAQRLACGFVPIRKSGKLPRPVYEVAYALEYGEDRLQIHRDAILPGESVVVVDDLLATGGTAKAAVQLVQACGGSVTEVVVLVELSELCGRQALTPTQVRSLVVY